jgi:3-ketosteroid 9alpha-monooxygenase subunit B
VADHPERLAVRWHYDDEHGIPDAQTLGQMLRRNADFHLYLCGPAPFMAMIQQAAGEAGVAGGRVHLERFDAAPVVASAAVTATAAMTSCDARVTMKGEQHAVRVEGGQSLLQAMLEAGLDVPYACEEGYCGSCAAKCLDGEVAHAHNDVFSLTNSPLVGYWRARLVRVTIVIDHHLRRMNHSDADRGRFARAARSAARPPCEPCLRRGEG